MITPFDVQIAQADELIVFRVAGFWEVPTLEGFRNRMGSAAVMFQKDGRPFDVLADMRDSPPQSQTVANGLQESMARGVKFGMRRTACLATRQLTKFQFSRIAAYRNFAFFDSEQAALDWLRDPLSRGATGLHPSCIMPADL